MRRRIVLASAVVIGVAACGSSSKKPAPAEPEPIANRQPAPTPAAAPAPATPGAVALAKMREFQAQMCACANRDCAKQVSDDMTAWAQQVKDQQTEPLEMSEEEGNAATAIGTKMGECLVNAMNAGAQPTQP